MNKCQEEARRVLAPEYLLPWLRGEATSERVSLEDDGTQFVVHGTNKLNRETGDVNSMCGMPIRAQWVITSHNDYVEVFRHVYAASFQRLHKRIQHRGKSLPAVVLKHANTKHAMTRHPTSIMCVGNQEQLATKTAAVLQAKPNSLQKPLHFDGTNSFEQLGSTTFGQRDVACWAENPNLEKVGNSLFWDEPEPTPDVVLHQHPGSVYFGRPLSIARKAIGGGGGET